MKCVACGTSNNFEASLTTDGLSCRSCGKQQPGRMTAKPSRAGRTPTRRHGLGKSGVDALLAQQGGSCAICGRPYEDKPGSRLAMDHDHRHHPGRVGCPQCIRGMVCHECNNILRLAHDDPERLRKAVAYLDRWEQVRATERGW